MADSALLIRSHGNRAVEPGSECSFGRSADCDVVIGSADRSVSRIAGVIRSSDGGWEVFNPSSRRPLYRVEEAGLRSVIAVGGVATLRAGSTRIIVVGAVETHVIEVEVSGDGFTAVDVAHGDSDATTIPTFTGNERVAIVALIEGFLLDPPRYEPRPRTYAEAGERLGVPAATIRKRIEHARSKLVDAGVVELEQSDARAALAEFVLATRLIGRGDLALLEGDLPH